VPPRRSPSIAAEHAPENALGDAGDIARFHDRCSDLMRELLGALAASPERSRTFPEVEDAIGWPRRRIASVLGGVAHLRQTEFGGRRPYRLQDGRRSASGRWEIWMDSRQAAAIRAERRPARPEKTRYSAAMSQQNVEKTRDFIVAYNRRDFDSAVASFHPEVEWVLPPGQSSDSAAGPRRSSASGRGSTRRSRS
jgi:hypothetical protein